MIEIPRPSDDMHEDLQQVLREAAATRDQLAARGYTDARIKEKVALGRHLAHLAARGVDVSAALPIEKHEEAEMTPEEEARYDHLDDIGIMNADEILHRIKE